jgi:hypothetical protein
MTRRVDRGTLPAAPGSWSRTAARVGLAAIVLLGLAFNLSNPLGLIAFLPNALVGFVLVVRRSHNPIGWLLLLMAAGFSLAGRPEIAAAALASGNTPWLPYAVWLATMTAIAMLAGIATLSAVFPSGRLPGGSTGQVTRLALLLFAAVAVLQALVPSFSKLLPDGTLVVIENPFVVAPGWSGWAMFDGVGPAYVVLLGAIVACIGGLLARFGRAVGVERQQYKWLLGSLALVAIALAFGFIAASVVGRDKEWVWLPGALAFPLPPIAIGIAVLRYRLYDIDRIISRTISYGVVSALLLAVYAGLVLILQGPLGAVTGGDTVAVAASTLVAAALFQPIRRRTQAAVDHRFNRTRYDAERTVNALAARLRDEMDLPIVRSAVVDAVAHSVEPSAASLWLRPGRAR